MGDAAYLDCFVPRNDAKRQRGMWSSGGERDRGSGPAMRVLGRECVVRNGSDNNGHRGWERQRLTGMGARARPKRGAAVAQGTTKRLTFREGRLRLTLQKSLPDLKVRRLGGRALGRWFWP